MQDATCYYAITTVVYTLLVNKLLVYKDSCDRRSGSHGVNRDYSSSNTVNSA